MRVRLPDPALRADLRDFLHRWGCVTYEANDDVIEVIVPDAGRTSADLDASAILDAASKSQPLWNDRSKKPKPADLSVLGLRPHNDLTRPNRCQLHPRATSFRWRDRLCNGRVDVSGARVILARARQA